MSWVAVIFTPVVLAYQTWTYWVFRKRIGRADIPAGVAAVIAPAPRLDVPRDTAGQRRPGASDEAGRPSTVSACAVGANVHRAERHARNRRSSAGRRPGDACCSHLEPHDRRRRWSPRLARRVDDARTHADLQGSRDLGNGCHCLPLCCQRAIDFASQTAWQISRFRTAVVGRGPHRRTRPVGDERTRRSRRLFRSVSCRS